MSRKIERSYDRHHLCWQKNQWRSGYANAIRNHPYFVMMIPRDTLHALIHREIRCIPVPDGRAAKLAYEEVMRLEAAGVLYEEDFIEKRLRLLIRLFAESAPNTAEGFRKQLSIVEEFYYEPP